MDGMRPQLLALHMYPMMRWSECATSTLFSGVIDAEKHEMVHVA